MPGGRRNKLELTWTGKGNRPKLEPRILLKDAEKSYHAQQRVTDHDIFDNRLLFGDNLLALKTLEQEFTGKIKCIFIDPPYNTGSAFEHYDDGVEHSLWLSLMRERLEILNRLLSPQGSLWITIDDNEAHYLKVLCDEVIGRNSSWQTSCGKSEHLARIVQLLALLMTMFSFMRRVDHWIGRIVGTSSLLMRQVMQIQTTTLVVPGVRFLSAPKVIVKTKCIKSRHLQALRLTLRREGAGLPRSRSLSSFFRMKEYIFPITELGAPGSNSLEGRKEGSFP
jgi:hypothetical protein